MKDDWSGWYKFNEGGGAWTRKEGQNPEGGLNERRINKSLRKWDC
jgi:hypothetical protein